jgi:hypothetical protein
MTTGLRNRDPPKAERRSRCCNGQNGFPPEFIPVKTGAGMTDSRALGVGISTFDIRSFILEISRGYECQMLRPDTMMWKINRGLEQSPIVMNIFYKVLWTEFLALPSGKQKMRVFKVSKK